MHACAQILLQPSAKVILAACDALAESEEYEKFLGATVKYVPPSPSLELDLRLPAVDRVLSLSLFNAGCSMPTIRYCRS
jgi:hypothetical protein